LEPQRAPVRGGLLGVERRGRELALEVGADHRGVRQHGVAVLEHGDLAERADLLELVAYVERDHRIELVVELLLGEGDQHLADERRRIGAKHGEHSRGLLGWIGHAEQRWPPDGRVGSYVTSRLSEAPCCEIAMCGALSPAPCEPSGWLGGARRWRSRAVSRAARVPPRSSR